MSWCYRARKYIEFGEAHYELVEWYGEELGATLNPVTMSAGGSKENLAKWLRQAADDVEKYDALGEIIDGRR